MEALRIPFAGDNPAVQSAARPPGVSRSNGDSWRAVVGILVRGVQARVSYSDDHMVHRRVVAGALDWASQDSLGGYVPVR